MFFDGVFRSLHVAWVEQSRWDALTTEQRNKSPPIAPDFVLEVPFRAQALQGFLPHLQQLNTSFTDWSKTLDALARQNRSQLLRASQCYS